jgi:hypothetical protein
MNTNNNDRLLIACIFLLGGICIAAGSWLIYKGFQSGELLIANGALVAINGLVMQLTGRKAATPPPSVTVSPPSNVTVNQQPTEPTP